MRDVIDQLEGWWKNGQTAALATVVGTFRSAPRQPGASMLVVPAGEAVGSVSGGCVEGAVYELGEQVLRDGRPVLQRYGVSDDDAFAVGLTCGGILDIFVEKVNPETYAQLSAVADAIRTESPVAVATVVAGPAERLGRRLVIWPDRVDGSTGSDRLDDSVRDDARGLLDAGRNAMVTYGVDGQRRGEGLSVFVESFAPPPRMIVFGAIDFAAACAKIGSFLGFRVTVCDARPVFATASRFPGANEVVVEWPHRYLAAEAQSGRTGRAQLAMWIGPSRSASRVPAPPQCCAIISAAIETAVSSGVRAPRSSPIGDDMRAISSSVTPSSRSRSSRSSCVRRDPIAPM